MGVHDDGDVLTAEVGEPRRAVIGIHGRGATASGFLRTLQDLATDARLLAPQAHRRSWYPESFLSPREQNQPWLDDALDRLEQLRDRAAEGVGTEQVHLIGFSQGACLVTEFAASHPQRYGSVTGLSGGLIGQEVERERYTGSLDGTPVFLGCSDQDPHIPEERVHATASVLRELDSAVEARIYPGMGHTINDDERGAVRELLAG